MESPIPLRCRVAHYLARIPSETFWRKLLWLSFSGLGYQNWIPSLNGEYRFLRSYLASHACDDLVIFDVGGSQGDFSALVLSEHRSARVHLFEPNPPTIERLRKRFADGHGRDVFGVAIADPPRLMRAMTERRAIFNFLALSDQPGTMTLYDMAEQPGVSEQATLYPEAFPADTALVTVTVPATTLDDYCRAAAVERIDYMKLDVEGAERKVLAGAKEMISRGAIGVIHMEQGRQAVLNGFSLAEISKALPGYDLHRLLPTRTLPMVSPSHAYDPTYDFARYHNLVAIRRA